MSCASLALRKGKMIAALFPPWMPRQSVSVHEGTRALDPSGGSRGSILLEFKALFPTETPFAFFSLPAFLDDSNQCFVPSWGFWFQVGTSKPALEGQSSCSRAKRAWDKPRRGSDYGGTCVWSCLQPEGARSRPGGDQNGSPTSPVYSN